MMCSVERPPHSFEGDFGGIMIHTVSLSISLPGSSFFFFPQLVLGRFTVCLLDGDSVRFSVRNDEMNHVGQM